MFSIFFHFGVVCFLFHFVDFNMFSFEIERDHRRRVTPSAVTNGQNTAQDSDQAKFLIISLLFAEDGGRLVHAGVMAPSE